MVAILVRSLHLSPHLIAIFASVRVLSHRLLISRLSEQRIVLTILLIQWLVDCPRYTFSSRHRSFLSPLSIVIATDLQWIIHLNH